MDVSFDLPTLVAVCNSIGAHLGAKLGAFNSDERTLTDELCDMFAIWSQALPRHPAGEIRIRLQKLTPSDEAKRGADLELVLTTPMGTKTALFQAKVVDSLSGKPRNFDRRAQAQLRKQLRKAEAVVGADLTFLLLYVPWNRLNGRGWGFRTWEQGFVEPTSGSLESFLGTTAIALADLTNKRRWRYRPGFKHVGDFASPNVRHSSFTRILLELACCQRGTPQIGYYQASLTAEREPTNAKTYLSLEIAPGIDREWSEIENRIRMMLDMPGEFGLDL